jgi:hypothetical protein
MTGTSKTLCCLSFLVGIGAGVILCSFLVDYIVQRNERRCINTPMLVECIDGYEYIRKSFLADGFALAALVPRWDQDGKPKRCPK